MNKRFSLRSTGLVATAVMTSRLLGLIREVLFNAIFGTSSMGVFLVAFRAPNILRDLFAEGALSISFITIFSKKIITEGDDAAWKLASKMMTLAFLVMSVISIFGIFYSSSIISIMAPGFSQADSSWVILLTQIMYPFILFVSLSALAMGILNSKNIFNVPAYASCFFNIGSILGGALFGWLIDPSFGKNALIGLAIGTLTGGILQFAVQIPSLRQAGFKFKFDFNWNDSDVQHVLLLTLPAVIAASALQINMIVNSTFASYIGAEAVTWLNSAFRLIQLPIGIFGVAIGTITLPIISRIAATENYSELGPTLSYALQVAVFLTLPASVGLWFFSEPIIRLIYEHGKFNPHDTFQTAMVLKYYAVGLVSFTCIKVIAPSFYALNKKWTPMCVSFLAIAINIVLNYIFIFKFKMGHSSLAISATIASTVNVMTLYYFLTNSHSMQTSQLIDNCVRCGIASIVLGTTCWLILKYFVNYIYHQSIVICFMSLVVAIIFAVMVYVLACLMARVDIVESLIGRLHKTVHSLYE